MDQSNFSGKLLLTILSGKGFAQGSSYYITATLDFDKLQTQRATPSKGDQVDWIQELTLLLDNPFSDIKLTLHDQKDQVLASLILPIVNFSDQQSSNKWYSMNPIREDGPKYTLQISANYRYKDMWNPIYKSISLLPTDPNTAIRILEQCISRFPEYHQLYSYRSQGYTSIGQFNSALEDAKHIVEMLPNSGEGYYRIGAVYFAAEEFSEAETAFKLGLSRDPNNELCKWALENIQRNALAQYIKRILAKARNAVQSGEYDLAISYYMDAIAKNPGNYIYYLYRGVANLLARHYLEATEDALKVVELEPKWPRNNPVKQSYLTKLGQYNLLMSKKRFFILKEYFIYYYNSSSDSKPNGVILLGPDFDLQKRSKKHLYIVNPKRTWELSADTEQERNEWLEILTKYLNTKIAVPKLPEEQELQIYLAEEQISGKFETLKNTALSSVSRVASVPVLAVGRAARRVKSQFSSVTFNAVIKEGFLFKKGEVNTQWKKRYWILQGQTLYYLKAKQETNTAKPAGSIELENCKIETDSKKLGKQFAFEIVTPSRSFFLSAKSEDQMSSWISAIKKAAGISESSDPAPLRGSVALDPSFRTSMDIPGPSSAAPSQRQSEISPQVPIVPIPVPTQSSRESVKKSVGSGTNDDLSSKPFAIRPVLIEAEASPKPSATETEWRTNSSISKSLAPNSSLGETPTIDQLQEGGLVRSNPDHNSFRKDRRARLLNSENTYSGKFGLSAPSYTEASVPKPANDDPLNLHANFQDDSLEPLLIGTNSAVFSQKPEEKGCCSCCVIV